MGQRLGVVNQEQHDLGIDPATVISAGKSGFDLVTGIFGNNRGSKRDKRDQYRNVLYNAGITRSALGHVHSDDWAELEKLAKFVEQNGQPAVEYLNENLGRAFGGTYGPTAQQVISGFSSSRQSSASNLPAARSVMTAGMSPISKYLMIAVGVSALGGAAWYGYENFNN